MDIGERADVAEEQSRARMSGRWENLVETSRAALSTQSSVRCWRGTSIAESWAKQTERQAKPDAWCESEMRVWARRNLRTNSSTVFFWTMVRREEGWKGEGVLGI